MFLLKPWYAFRPAQIVRRLTREVFQRNAGIVCVDLPWKAPLKIAPNSGVVSRAIWTTGIYDLAVSEALWRLTPRGGTSVDAGANLGYMTNLLACRVGKSGRVFAFEPHPEIFQQLTANLALLHEAGVPAGEVKPYQKALSDSARTAWLSLPPGFDNNLGLAQITNLASDRGFQVETVSLDTIVDDALIDVMKIDVEGHEASVLAGAEQALAHCRIKHIVFEEHGGLDSPSFNILHHHGYQVYQLGWSFARPRLASLSAARICNRYEAPNFIATVDSEQLKYLMAPKGWQVLRGR